MTRTEMTAEVGRLLAEAASLRRYGLSLGPRESQRLKSLLLALGWYRGDGATQMSRSNADAAERQPVFRQAAKRLPRRVLRYAKAEKTRHPAHANIAGFPLETALRHLANDPDNSDTLRQTAFVALTGKRGDHIDPEGHPEALWALNDLLQEPEHNKTGASPHPLFKAYNWMSAADKLVLDAKTKRALEEAAEDYRRQNPHGDYYEGGDPKNGYRWWFTPEHQAMLAGQSFRKAGTQVPAMHAARVAVADRIRARVKQLHPGATDEDVNSSIRRHAFRAGRIGNRESLIAADASKARDLIHPKDGPDSPEYQKSETAKNELETRYRRRKLVNADSVSALGPKRPRKYALNARGDFIDALRRARSSQNVAIKQAVARVAGQMGFHPVSAISALHDGPHGATPGIAVALSGRGSPEQVHGLAGWAGQIGNEPGVAAFHVRPTGPDNLYRFRFAGSGYDLRAKLDRAGIRQRVLVPHKAGYDVLLPDPGGAMARNVAAFAKLHKVQLQASKGYFKVLGSADRADSREKFRGAITTAERMRRKPRRYAMIPKEDPTLRSWWGQALPDQNKKYVVDHTAAGALGDFMEEHGDWRHWLLRRFAEPSKETDPQTGAVKYWIRPDGLTSNNTEMTRRGFRSPVAVPHDDTSNPHFDTNHRDHGAVSRVNFGFSNESKPVVMIHTTHPSDAGNKFAFSIMTPEEYGAMRQDAEASGVKFPAAPATHGPAKMSRRRTAQCP